MTYRVQKKSEHPRGQKATEGFQLEQKNWKF